MLQLIDVCKTYRTGDLVQKALDRVSLNLRDNEFVAILGPSGSGKTTLLNIIGGLDRYDSGDLVINGVSTKKYKDRDWDSYRNHTVGFVFQSYNLIPHQTILANVELALTISGVSPKERRRRAREALEQVGLGDQAHKKPNQMSGGQMQRVALARALVNDPDILLADEPTGALDTETSAQVMALLKEVARDRMVVMVTHNAELAAAYATRIVNLRDGQIVSDSNPLAADVGAEPPVHRSMGRASMSFLTALSLSLNNLLTKKARTILVAFAGSIGIIGIALILSLSNGVDRYIASIEEQTLSQYPMQIEHSSVDFSAMLTAYQPQNRDMDAEVKELQTFTGVMSELNINDLGAFKAYLESGTSGIEPYVNTIEYSYAIVPQIFREEGDKLWQVNPDQTMSVLGMNSTAFSSAMTSSMNTFHSLPEDSGLYQSQYDVKAGHWPTSPDELVVVLFSDGSLRDMALYALGLKDMNALQDLLRNYEKTSRPGAALEAETFRYTDLLGIELKLVPATAYYTYDAEYGVWADRSGDEAYLKQLAAAGRTLTVVGVVQAREDAEITMLTSGVCYLPELITDLILDAEHEQIVIDQQRDPEINVFTGKRFDAEEPVGFSMENLFTLDSEAMQNAFRFDQDALSGVPSGLDLGGMDFSDLIDPNALAAVVPSLSERDLVDLLRSVEFHIDPAQMETLLKTLLQGFADYAAQDPSTDVSALGAAVQDYLQSAEARSLIAEQVRILLGEKLDVLLNQTFLEQTLRTVLEGYPAFAAEQPDPTDYAANFQAYLQSPAVQAALEDAIGQIRQSASDLQVQPEEISALVTALVNGYNTYAAENGAPQPERIMAAFSDYLNTDESKALLTQAVTDSVDLSGLEEKLSQTVSAAAGKFAKALSQQLSKGLSTVMGRLQNALSASFGTMFSNLDEYFRIDADAFGSAIKMNLTEQELQSLLSSLMSTERKTYETNLKTMGYQPLASPDSVLIYPLDFESKQKIADMITAYNARMEAEGAEEKVLHYTDMVGALMGSVTDIVDIVSYVLIAFVAISLVVSSIMIGVITYISVLERKKEIGILRAIGASKRNIANVFNAETVITGFLAGVLGVGITLLLLIPANYLLHTLTGHSEINAVLPPLGGFLLIVLSVFLTLIGGLIPSGKAARSDPVTALRTE